VLFAITGGRPPRGTRMVTIVGVNDDHRARNGENALRSAP
jgi:hypothetical protein